MFVRYSETCRLSRLLVLLASLCFFAGPLFAQLPTATILGVVKDSSGGVVSGATVMVRNVDTDLSRTLTTQEDGSYRVPALPVGNYEVQVTREGFKTATRKGLTLTVGQEAVVDPMLEVGSTGQTVVVTEEAPLVDTTNGSLGGLVTEQKVQDLPLNGRNFVDLTLLQPGVTQLRGQIPGNQPTSGVIFSSNGAPTRSNSMLLDGATMVTLNGLGSSSVAGTTLGVDGIKEYKIVTNLFSAEYGLTMGSQTTIVSKGGSNQFHGDVFEYLRNSVLDARNFFDAVDSRGQSIANPGHRLPQFQRNQFGGSFGGPIKKDRTFFYAVYEGLRENLGVTVLDTVPAAGCHPPGANAGNNFGAGTRIWNGNGVQPAGSIGPCPQVGALPPVPPPNNNSVVLSAVTAPLLALYPLPNVGANQFTFPALQKTNENYGQIRFDQTFSSEDTFFVRYTADDAHIAAPNIAAGVGFPQFRNTYNSRSQFLTLSESHIISPTVVNTARGSFSRTAFFNTSDSTLSGPLYSFVAGQQIGTIAVGSVGGSGGALSGLGPSIGTPAYSRQNVFTVSDDLYWTKGKHAMKFGTLINYYQQGLEFPLFSKGLLVFPSIGNFFTGTPLQFSALAPGANTNRYFTYNTFGFYAQDDVRVASRLTVNLGLRYEFSTTPNERNGRGSAVRDVTTQNFGTLGPVVRNPSIKSFSPRIGFECYKFGKGKNSKRVGYGLYYDIAGIGAAISYGSVATPPFSGRGQIRYNPPFNTTFTIPFTFSPANTSNTLQTLDYNAHQPYLQQYNLTVEHQFPGRIAVSVGYVGSRGEHLWQAREENPVIPTSVTNEIAFWQPLPGGALGPRINPFWGGVTAITTGGDSWYNSLQVQVTKQMARGLQFQAAYTFSKALDTTQGQVQGPDPTTDSTDALFPRHDRGPTGFDVTHNLRFNMLYHFPNIKSENFAAKILHGWWMANVVAVQSGYPFTPTTTFSRSGEGLRVGNDRPNLVTAANVGILTSPVCNPLAPPGSPTFCGGGTCNPSVFACDAQAVVFNPNTVITGLPTQWFNIHMFTANTAGFLGNVSRGLLRGPGLGTWDLSLNKDTRVGFLGESGAIQFRAEFFNLLNRKNLAIPDNTTTQSVPGQFTAFSPSPTGGQILSTVTTSRQIQFALKLIF